MKKTLLALMVAGVASTAGAAEIMNTGNLSVTTDANFEVSYQYDAYQSFDEKGNEESRDRLAYDDAEIAFTAESIINDNWTAFLKYGLEMKYDDASVGSTDIVGGFKFFNNHLIEFGRAGNVLDLGSTTSYNIGLDVSQDELDTYEDIIAYYYTGDAFSAGVSYSFDLSTSGDDNSAAAVFLGGDVGGFNIRGDFGYQNPEGNDADLYVYGLKLGYAGDLASFGAAYTGTTTSGLDDENTGDLYDLWVSWSATSVDWSIGVQYIDIETASIDKDGTLGYVNATYPVNDVVGLYAELGYLDSDAKDAGMGGSVGMTMSF